MSIRIMGVAIFVIAALYTWQAGSYAITFGDVLGPTVFPVIVGIPMMILSASLVVFPAGQVDWPAPQRMWRQLAALAVLVAYTMTLEPLGFPLATFALVALIGIILGGAPWRAILLGAVMAPALWALFDQVLGLPLDFLGELFVAD
ncbi:tripartite tricarboxylate transporter TctB family protein [Roseibacterium sp. SDUM158017]|uniref:tripartite tricarboxylate transporter TctB family protein n=1 Tax=Roseicyclus salinarum TaxID=3036773 RepID=UPI002414DD7C|nr:tripartite tricarboxylate transporter TctB family protein [Roseibacterium sp. SDUM158017]MDG4648698.1 tripartite tricarboxylate transporter TctB family protein [Roseibacterium sp. SDUM158017]